MFKEWVDRWTACFNRDREKQPLSITAPLLDGDTQDLNPFASKSLAPAEPSEPGELEEDEDSPRISLPGVHVRERSPSAWEEHWQSKWEEAEEALGQKSREDVGLGEKRAHSFENQLDEAREAYFRGVHKLGRRPRISVAFSGGGQRAASCASGLLWALAKHGFIANLKHISAVSGGGYTASLFGAHLKEQAEKDPPQDGDLHAWYFKVVWKSLLHMQDNISHLTGSPKDGLCRMTFNTLRFGFCTIASMVVNALTFTIYTTVPIATLMVHDVAPDIRHDFCDLTQQLFQIQSTFEAWRTSVAVSSLPWVMGFAFMITLLSSKVKPDEKARWSFRNSRYFVVHHLRLISTRWVTLICCYTLILLLVIFEQHLGSGIAGHQDAQGAQVRCMCENYIKEAMANTDALRCTDFYARTEETNIGAWYNHSLKESYTAHYGSQHGCRENAFQMAATSRPFIDNFTLGGPLFNLTTPSGYAWCICLVIAIFVLMATILRLHVVDDIVQYAGPALNVWVLSEIMRWKTYGPITKQPLIWGDRMRYSDELGTGFFTLMVLYILVTLPIVGHMMEFGHNMNSWGLRRALYPKDRQDMLLNDARNIYSPNLIFGSCLQDWGRPTDKEPYDDFELTPLQIGGRRTNYWPTGLTRIKMFTAVGVSGAAADIVMSTAHSEKARWWVAMLSVRMGAWVRVREWTHGFFNPSRKEYRLLNTHQQEMFEEFWLRLPGISAMMLWFLLVLLMSLEFPAIPNYFMQEENCESVWYGFLCKCQNRQLFRLLVAGFAIFFILVHMSHVPLRRIRNVVVKRLGTMRSASGGRTPSGGKSPSGTRTMRTRSALVSDDSKDVLDIEGVEEEEDDDETCNILSKRVCRFGNFVAFNIHRSPLIRNILMMCGHFHKSWSVPEYLYLVDGGVMDSLGVLALLRRKERWIIALDAAGPATDPCRFIRESLERAIAMKLCSFADPEGTARHFGYLLEDYANSCYAANPPKNAEKKKKADADDDNDDDNDASRIPPSKARASSAKDDAEKNGPVLHLKVLYETNQVRGDIFFIRVQCAEEGLKQAQKGLLRAPLQQNGMGKGQAEEKRPPRGELHGAVCCDSCHDNRCSDGCAKAVCAGFPLPAMGNQFLTPRMFAELCHLGHELGDTAIQKMMEVMRKDGALAEEDCSVTCEDWITS